MITHSEAKIIELAIDKLRMRIEEEREQFRNLQVRFPTAHLECLEEVLNRFESRLSSECIISEEVQPEPSFSDCKQGSANKN